MRLRGRGGRGSGAAEVDVSRAVPVRTIRLRTALALAPFVLCAVLLPLLSRRLVVAGFVLGFLLLFAGEFCDAKRPWKRHGPDGRFVTAHTVTGLRTIDLHDLRSVRSRLLPVLGSFAGTPRIVLTDRAGNRLRFELSIARGLLPPDLLTAVARPQGACTGVYVSRFALADLGRRPLPPVVDFLRSLGAIERMALTVILPGLLSFLLTLR